MNKSINILLITFLIWVTIFAILGKDTLKWSVIVYTIESCIFAFLLHHIKIADIGVINWVVNTAIAYLIYRIIVGLAFFINRGIYEFLNNNIISMLVISITILLSLIFNRKKL